MKKIAFLFLLLGGSNAYAQRHFTLEETVFGSRSYAPQSIKGQQWIPGQQAFSYIDIDLQGRKASNNWKSEVLLTTAALNNALAAKFPDNTFSLKNFPASYRWKDAYTISMTVPVGKQIVAVEYDLRKKTMLNSIAAPADAAEYFFSKDGRNSAYLVANNIEIQSADGQKWQVTTDANTAIVNGSSATHRQEFGIDRGMWWSPNSESLLYYRKDESMVAKYPLINWGTRMAQTNEIPYPMAGETNEQVSLQLFNLKTQQTIKLQTGEPLDQYLTSVTWDPSGKYIYVGLLNRGQDHMRLTKYAAADGRFVATLFEEKLSSWVEPQHPLLFLPTQPNQFLYQTDQHGYNQFYLYNTEGKLLKSLGYKDVIVDQVLSFSEDGTKLTYIGITNNGLDRQAFELDLKTFHTKELTSLSGTHQASSNGRYLFDQYSNTTTANKAVVKDLKSGKTTELLNASNPLDGKITMPKMEFITLTSADGKTPLNARILYPTNFDASKKYPVMFYLYGGSHAQLVTNKWLGGAGYFDYYMAQQGYIVFTMDNRGSDARGRDFTRVTHRQLGQAEMADQLQGVSYLQTQSFVDTKRMGIFGWSFGGFMTTSLMVNKPEIFQAAVAGGPVIDWKYYEAMYGERYMDTPQENPVGYAQSSLLNKAEKLKGNLLIIHGAQDPVVVQQHSMAFIEACIKAGKQVDYFLYPTHEHNVSGKDRIHMYEKIARYFDLHLKK